MDKKRTHTKVRTFAFTFSFQNIVFLSLVVCAVGYIGYVIGFRSGMYRGFTKAAHKIQISPARMRGCTRELKICPDGTSVGRSGPYCEFEACPTARISKTPPRDNCVIGGCSGQICSDAADGEGIATTCEWKEEYACYTLTTCEQQANGACGWTSNIEFNTCIMNAKPPSNDKMIY
ncbi:hypothetical protein KAZ66_04880 [Candidatus Woesebacteria bacterium]|nr:hypothetical protein [Candidatus Woesebacteria bacterium]